MEDALKWYRQAAKGGSAETQFTIGHFHELGYGVSQDAAEAVRWFTRGAESKDCDAMERLAACYAEGRGVPRDLAMAHMWFSLERALIPMEEGAAKAGLDRIEAQMTPAEIERAKGLTRTKTECLGIAEMLDHPPTPFDTDECVVPEGQ